MAYEKYTTECVFNDPSANVICNNIMNALEAEFGAADTNNNFGLTGSVAKIIQGDPKFAVQVIPYVTVDIDMFNFLKNNISNIISTVGVVLNSDRIMVTTTFVYKIEFWYRSAAITLVNTNGIYGELKANIPAYIL